MEQNEKNVELLIKELYNENKELKEYNASLADELKVFQEHFGDSWFSAKEFKECIEAAKEAQKKYQQAEREVRLLKEEYKQKLEDLVKSFTN